MGKRPFIDTLREIEYGHLLEDLTDAHHTVVQAVQETQKKGKITITLNYIPEGNGQLTIAVDDPKVSAPQSPRGKTLFYLTPEGNTTRNDPRQMEIGELRSVKDDEEPVRKVTDGN